MDDTPLKKLPRSDSPYHKKKVGFPCCVYIDYKYNGLAGARRRKLPTTKQPIRLQCTFLGHVADTSDTCVPGRSLGAALSEGDAEEPDPPHWAAWCLRGQCAGASGQDGSVPAGVEPAASLHLGAAAGLDAVRAGWRLVIGDACALRGMRFAHFVKLYALLCAN